MLQRSLPVAGSLRRLSFGLSDIAVFLGALALLALLAKIGAGAFVAFVPPETVPAIGLDPRNLPYYAARSTLRMFVALAASFAFTFAYGYVAARSRYAERVLVPLLDILQSVPVLLFRHQVIERVPIVATIAKTLAEKENKSMRADFFLDLLDEYYPENEARLQFNTAVEWGRYAELFEYDADEERLLLDENAVAS